MVQIPKFLLIKTMDDRLKRIGELGKPPKQDPKETLAQAMAELSQAYQEDPAQQDPGAERRSPPPPGAEGGLRPMSGPAHPLQPTRKRANLEDRVVILERTVTDLQVSMQALIAENNQLKTLVRQIGEELGRLRKESTARAEAQAKIQMIRTSTSYNPPELPKTQAPSSVVSSAGKTSVSSTVNSESQRWHASIKPVQHWTADLAARYICTAYQSIGQPKTESIIRTSVNTKVLKLMKDTSLAPSASIVDFLADFQKLTKHKAKPKADEHKSKQDR